METQATGVLLLTSGAPTSSVAFLVDLLLGRKGCVITSARAARRSGTGTAWSVTDATRGAAGLNGGSAGQPSGDASTCSVGSTPVFPQYQFISDVREWRTKCTPQTQTAVGPKSRVVSGAATAKRVDLGA
ncbi:hypothetical protein DFH09DRAFT_1096802 [Mycena vulgaris]|nr:hypothetical protein DFH09DRAFT_1096802 [Mycena vulgaris]